MQAGARIAEYVAGAYAALGALTALRIAPAGQVTEVDVSVLEALLSTLPYPMLMFERMRALGLPTNVRQAPMLGVVRAADGWVGINCLTGQHWLDVCDMLGLPEFGEQQFAIMMGGPERAEFYRGRPAVAGRADRRRHRRTLPGTADSGGAGGRRRSRAGQSRNTPSVDSSSRAAARAGRFGVRGRPFGFRKHRPRPAHAQSPAATTGRAGRGPVAAVRGVESA